MGRAGVVETTVLRATLLHRLIVSAFPIIGAAVCLILLLIGPELAVPLAVVSVVLFVLAARLFVRRVVLSHGSIAIHTTFSGRSIPELDVLGLMYYPEDVPFDDPRWSDSFRWLSRSDRTRFVSLAFLSSRLDTRPVARQTTLNNRKRIQEWDDAVRQARIASWSPMPPTTEQAREFELRWVSAWSALRPIHGAMPRERSVRFHSLPQSAEPRRRSERAEAVRRHLQLISELQASHPDAALVVVIEGYMRADVGRNWHLKYFPLAWVWRQDIREDPDDPDSLSSYFVDDSPRTVESLARVMYDVTFEKLGYFVVTNRSLSWLYQPYYAGTDLVATDEAQLHALVEAHRDWLPNDREGS
jgi:hypothetical protein